MNKKGALELEKYLSGIMLFSLFIIVGVMFMQDIDTNYDDVSMSTSDYDSNFNMTGEMYNLTEEIKDAAGVKEIEETDTPNSLFAGAYSALTLVAKSYRLVENVVDSIMRVLPIPPIFKTVSIVILALFISFSIVYLIFRFQPRK